MNWDILAEGRSPRRYQPGQIIYLQGTQPDHFYYLLSGTARSFISTQSMFRSTKRGDIRSGG